VDNINAAVNQIPNVDVEITEAKGAITGKWRDCCDDANILNAGGERYIQFTATLSADIEDIVIWGPPTIDATFEIAEVLRADIEITAGVTLASDFSVSGTCGKRLDDCIPEECGYGSFKADVDLELSATLDMSYCIKLLWWEHCGSIEWTPASVSCGFAVGVSYNSPTSCTEGFAGESCLKDITFKTSFKIGSTVGLEFERSIYDGDCG